MWLDLANFITKKGSIEKRIFYSWKITVQMQIFCDFADFVEHRFMCNLMVLNIIANYI